MDIKEQLKSMSGHEKVEFLDSNCYRVEEGEYFKPYDIEEQTIAKEQLSEISISLERKEQELADLKLKLKGVIDPLKKEFKKTLQTIMQNGENTEGKLYLFDDQANGIMEYYDRYGNLISTRRLRPEERQLNLRKAINQ